MPRYYIWTIGCQMNKAESERLDNAMEQMGYQSAPTADEADVIVLNTCVVRQSAENKAINKLKALYPLKKARPDVILAVTGCMVNSNAAQLAKEFTHVDHFFKPGDFPHWLDSAKSRLPRHPSPSSFVPIIQGCDNFCSYCIVPYRRGREQSRPVQEVVAEVRELAKLEVKEVTLLGQNVDSYGHDLPDRPDLAALLHELNDIQGLARIRFLTSHPKDINVKLIEAVARLDKVCEHINLPVQSGDDEILKAMRRDYNVEHYRQLIGQIRDWLPAVALSTDVIVGFPSESERQFQHTYELLRELRFDTVHVAAYSPRAGTIAARELEDNVAVAEKKARLCQVEQLQSEIGAEINARLSGRSVEILVEGKKGNKWQGRTRTDKLVFFSDRNDRLGQLVDVNIEKTTPWSLQGTLKTS